MRYSLAALTVLIGPFAMPTADAQGFGLPSLKDLEKGVRDKVEDTIESGVRGAQENVAASLTEPKSDRDVIASYSRNQKYIVQGAIIGAITGVGVNCIENVTSSDECLDGAALAAAVGGGLGAAGGWIVASRQNEYENQSDALEKKLNSARLELEQARTNRDAAERIVQEHEREIERLTAKTNLSSAERNELKVRLATIQEDNEILLSSIDRLDMEINALQQTINELQQSEARTQFEEIKVSLVTERDTLQGKIDRLKTLSAMG